MGKDVEDRKAPYHWPPATNLRRLIAHKAGGSVNAWATAHPAMNQTTINRIVSGERDCTVATLMRISEKTGYALWQLCHPDFDPLKMPPLMREDVARVAALFAAIDAPLDRLKAEAILHQFVKPVVPGTAEESAGTRPPLQASK
jgi:hypothetical protein